jgi:hypothetical protein
VESTKLELIKLVILETDWLMALVGLLVRLVELMWMEANLLAVLV